MCFKHVSFIVVEFALWGLDGPATTIHAYYLTVSAFGRKEKVLTSLNIVTYGTEMQETSRGRFPYFVSIKDIKGEHVCSGVLIEARHVLTAAHCILDGVGNNSVVVIGAHNATDGIGVDGVEVNFRSL